MHRHSDLRDRLGATHSEIRIENLLVPTKNILGGRPPTPTISAGTDGFDTIEGASGADHCVDFAGPVHGTDVSDREHVIIGLGGEIGGITG